MPGQTLTSNSTTSSSAPAQAAALWQSTSPKPAIPCSSEVTAFLRLAQIAEDKGWWFYVKHFSNETQAALDDKLVWDKPNGGLWVGTDPPEGSTQQGIWYPRANTLGSCDTRNGGITVLPSESDWDNIASITGDKSWHYDKMHKLFEKMERNLFLPRGTPGHGFSGYQPVGVGNKTLFEQDQQMLAMAQGSAAALGYLNRSVSTDFDVVTQKDINEALPTRDYENDVYQISFKKNEKSRRFSAGSRVNSAVARGLPRAGRPARR